MDQSTSPVKTVRQSQLRGAKALPGERSRKEASVQKEGLKPGPRSKENFTAAKDEHISSQVSRGPGKTSTDTPQDKRRGRPPRLTRLTGRTSSGERGKGRVASSHQQQLVALAPADSSPSAGRETSSPERGLTEQKSSGGAGAKERSHGGWKDVFPVMSTSFNVPLVKALYLQHFLQL